MGSPFLHQPFTFIGGVDKLADGVFAALMEDNTGLVIKNENKGIGAPIVPANLAHNLKMGKMSGPMAKSKLLDAGEIAAINRFIALYDVAVRSGQASDPGVESLRGEMAKHNNNWMKMDSVPGLTDLGAALTKLQNKDKSGIRAIAKALNAPGGFETLGKILAIDLYNGNEDRFRLNDHQGQENGMYDDRLGKKPLVMVNLGNVMVSVTQKVATLVGLDTYDPQGDFSDITKSIDKLEQSGTWPGRVLAHKESKRLKGYALDVYTDLETALGPRNRKLPFASKNRLDKNGPDRIYAGMVEASKMLRDKLSRLITKAGMIPPIGLQSRLNIIST